MVGRQAHILEPFHEIRAEHLSFSIEHIAPKPGAFAPAQAKWADVIQLLPQFPFVDQFRQRNVIRAVYQGKRHRSLGLVSKHWLTHQQFVEVRIDQRPDNRVNLPFVIVYTGRNVDHGELLQFP